MCNSHVGIRFCERIKNNLFTIRFELKTLNIAYFADTKTTTTSM